MRRQSFIVRAVACACLAWGGPAAAVDFSTFDLKGNSIPVSDADARFTLADGRWASVIRLPDNHPRDGVQYHIATSAAYPVTLQARNTDLGIDSLTLRSGDQVSFRYRKDKNIWSIVGPIQTPNAGSDTIKVAPGSFVSIYELRDGNWTGNVRLPSSAAEGALALIRSSATWPSAIDATHALFQSSLRLQRGDSYLFQFSRERARWIPLKTARRQIQAGSIRGQLPPPTAPVTEVHYRDGNWTPNISLPHSAGDRDRIVFDSRATWTASLLPDPAMPNRVVRIGTGQRYEFTYVKSESKWRITSHPRTRLLAQQLKQGIIPKPTTPITEVLASDGNWARELVLPPEATPGDAVIVQSAATWGFQVRASTPNAAPRSIKSGDIVRFTFDDKGQWDAGTNVVDILLVYSDAAAERLGDQAMRMRLYEGLRLTNEALENSKANVYFNAVGVLRRSVQGGPTLPGALGAVTSDPAIQAELRNRKADAVYYEGTEDGCGYGYLRAGRSHMAGAGSLNCGTTVMRHELGHNLGLSHGGELGANPRYAVGYSLHATVMGGNAIPYFSNPRIMHPVTGEDLGIPDKIDAVRVINDRSREIAAFR